MAGASRAQVLAVQAHTDPVLLAPVLTIPELEPLGRRALLVTFPRAVMPLALARRQARSSRRGAAAGTPAAPSARAR